MKTANLRFFSILVKAGQAWDLQQSQVHYQQADRLAKRFKLQTAGVERLSRRMLVVEEKKTDLLNKANEALKADRPVTPKGDNAVVYAGQILKIEAGHAGTGKVLEAVVGRLITLGESAMQAGQIPRAKGYQKTAEELMQRLSLSETGLAYAFGVNHGSGAAAGGRGEAGS